MGYVTSLEKNNEIEWRGEHVIINFDIVGASHIWIEIEIRETSMFVCLFVSSIQSHSLA